MCGVCASTSATSAASEAWVARINAAQRHRGPDGSASVVVGGSCLGNTRLAIIAPGHEGDQPLLADDGTCTMVFNGEIYNYRELVLDHGLRRDCSDGAVIPQLWSRYGSGAFRLLRGMYAIVLADHRTSRLVLARDPLGIKPLHWRVDERGLLISSEVRPLLHPDDEVDRQALGRFLHLGALPPAGSPVVDISAVPPNTWLSFEGTSLVDQGQVLPSLDLAAGGGTDVAGALRESVDLHLRSDVPTALLLSSGVDSSAVAWAAREASQTLHCLTVDLGGGRAEASEAARTATWFDHTHEVVRRPPDERDVADYFAAMQRPSIDGLNTFVVSRAVRDAGYKVALSGLGGDEATAGYAHFRYLRRLKALARADRAPVLSAALAIAVKAGGARVPAKAAELLSLDGPRDAWELSLLQRRVWHPALVARALDVPNSDLVQDNPTGRGRTDAPALTAAEYRTYLQSTLLPDADAFSMASSVELRVPLVDIPFLAAAVAAGGPRGLAKVGFARALGDARLEELARAPKQGFSLPMDRWMRDGILREHLERAKARDAPLWQHVDRTIGLDVFESWAQRASPWSHAWALVVLDGWLRSLP